MRDQFNRSGVMMNHVFFLFTQIDSVKTTQIITGEVRRVLCYAEDLKNWNLRVEDAWVKRTTMEEVQVWLKSNPNSSLISV